MNKGEFLAIAQYVGAIAIIIAIGYGLSWLECSRKTIGFDDYKYGAFQGCMVEYKGRWLPLGNIRGFGDTD